MTITERIFELLKEQGKKQKDLIKFIEAREATVINWKQKNIAPNAEYIPKIAEFLGVSMAYILTGEEERTATHACGTISTQSAEHAPSATAGMGEMTAELLRILDNLTIKNKNSLLTFAYQLEEEQNKQ